MRIAIAAILLVLGKAHAAEHVWHRLPDGFHPTNPVFAERLVALTWVPAGQDDLTWTQAISVQSFAGMRRTARELATAFDDIARRSCVEPGEFATWSDGVDDDGTPYVTAFHRCRTADGVQASVTRVLQGRAGDYVLSIAFDHAPARDELDRLYPFVRDARLCDDGDPARACPAGGIAPVYVKVIHTGRD